MRPLVRWGLLYVLALLLLAGLGHRNQMEARSIRTMEEELKKLRAEEVRLLKTALLSARPLEILRWAEKRGLVPMSEGRWGR